MRCLQIQSHVRNDSGPSFSEFICRNSISLAGSLFFLQWLVHPLFLEVFVCVFVFWRGWGEGSIRLPNLDTFSRPYFHTPFLWTPMLELGLYQTSLYEKFLLFFLASFYILVRWKRCTSVASKIKLHKQMRSRTSQGLKSVTLVLQVTFCVWHPPGHKLDFWTVVPLNSPDQGISYTALIVKSSLSKLSSHHP